MYFFWSYFWQVIGDGCRDGFWMFLVYHIAIIETTLHLFGFFQIFGRLLSDPSIRCRLHRMECFLVLICFDAKF